MEPSEIYEQVNKQYSLIVKSHTGHYENTVATAFGYTEEELAGIPDGANLGLSCGNPLALARLREGESLIDLGSGAGFDVFTASKRVGRAGKAIGVDMNKDMIDKANANKAQINASNVQFIESAITSIPLPGNTTDCIISNCVINLVPASEKQLVFNEMFRLLKPGGRVAISDILARKEFTEEIKKSVALYVGCVAGASQVSEYAAYLKNAGFGDVLIVDSKNDLNVYFTAAMDNTSCCGGADAVENEAQTCCGAETKEKCCGLEEKESCCGTNTLTCACERQKTNEAKTLASQMGITDLNEWAGSFQVYAAKPATT